MYKKIILAEYIKGASLLASSSNLQQMGAGAPMMAPSSNPCGTEGAKCTSSPSTLIIVIAGMCAMMLLVVVAILLLFFSHFRYRQRLRALQQFNYQQSILGEPSLTPPSSNSCENSNPPTCDGVVLVLLPGDNHAFSCAKPCPFSLEAPPSSCELASTKNIKEKECD